MAPEIPPFSSPSRIVRQDIPALSREQMEDVDRLASEVFHIELIQMMENAGRQLAELVRARCLMGNVQKAHIAVLAGRGGNGGGALVSARHLANWGAQVDVILARAPASFRGVPAHQLEILQAMEIPLHFEALPPGSVPWRLIIDGIIGYSLTGAPAGEAAKLIHWANRQGAPVFSLDTPSGLDVTSGKPFEPTVEASVTMTVALPKRGLLQPQAAPFVGELYLADISIPTAVYTRLGIPVPRHLFSRQSILRIN